MKHRRTILCFAILVLGIIFGFLFIFPFLATNLGLFPSLETNEPLELSWSVGPPQGDIFSGVWYNDSLVLEVRNNDSENDYRIFCYILINHETEILENTSITVAVSTFLEESETWADAQLV
ncbi:MAG: hypothetical protein KAV87_08005, partial [Desulfobacteraceae bacterium]|nr:hypothetical protein [Desulfobacteraceae bacterium]